MKISNKLFTLITILALMLVTFSCSKRIFLDSKKNDRGYICYILDSVNIYLKISLVKEHIISQAKNNSEMNIPQVKLFWDSLIAFSSRINPDTIIISYNLSNSRNLLFGLTIRNVPLMLTNGEAIVYDVSKKEYVKSILYH